MELCEDVCKKGGIVHLLLSRARCVAFLPSIPPPQVLGGAASDRLGGKPVMAVALLSTAVGVLVYARLASFGYMWLTMLLIGAMQGPSYPTNSVVISRWVPRSERAFATSVSDAGGAAGALVALFATPFVAGRLGWRTAMATSGLVTLSFTVLWQVLAANGPRECGYISPQELEEMRALGVAITGKAHNARKGTSGAGNTGSGGLSLRLLWRILGVPSAWSVLLAHSAFNYNRYLMYSWMVSYFTDALGVSVTEAGARMICPTIADTVTALLVGRAADALVNSGRLSTLAARRLFSTVGFLGVGSCAVLIGVAEDIDTITVLATIAGSAEACHIAGFKSSYADLRQGQMGSALMGSLQISCVLTEGLFGYSR